MSGKGHCCRRLWVYREELEVSCTRGVSSYRVYFILSVLLFISVLRRKDTLEMTLMYDLRNSLTDYVTALISGWEQIWEIP